MFTPSGSFKTCIKYLQDKASRAMLAIWSSLRTLPVIPVNTYLNVFDFMIKPILLYGSEVWGPYEIKANTNSTINSLLINCKCQIEKFHSKFCKQVLRVHKFSSNVAVRGELDRYIP